MLITYKVNFILNKLLLIMNKFLVLAIICLTLKHLITTCVNEIVQNNKTYIKYMDKLAENVTKYKWYTFLPSRNLIVKSINQELITGDL